MPKFRINLTCELTASSSFEIEARDEDHANELSADALYEQFPELGWEIEERSPQSVKYVDIVDIEEVED